MAIAVSLAPKILQPTDLNEPHYETGSTFSILPEGENLVTGAFSDNKNNRMVYFIHNSNGDHGTCEYNWETKTQKRIV